jgi:hypothetical protein
MAWWIYKCNSKGRARKDISGDWDEFFADPSGSWGNVNEVPDLRQLDRGDKVIAYQTDRNELVGVVKVLEAADLRGDVYFTPVERIGAKVRPLKKKDPKIDAIPALQPAWIATLYPISPQDVDRLLKAARAAKRRLPKGQREDKGDASNYS